MRLGIKSPDEFLQLLGRKNQSVQDAYLQKITKLARTASVKVMLGDSTITEQTTFDPAQVSDFLQRVGRRLDKWSVQDVSVTNNEDIRRIFLKFEKMVGSYLVSGHLSIQFHVLLYYMPDHRVIDCQKELSELMDLTKTKEEDLAGMGDQFVLRRLKEMGHDDLDHQALFEILYHDDDLREKIHREIEDADMNLKSLSEKKAKLFDELDSLLLETYQMSHTLIDDARLVTGEEGCLCTFDMELVKDNSKHGQFNPAKMSKKAKSGIIEEMDNMFDTLNSC